MTRWLAALAVAMFLPQGFAQPAVGGSDPRVLVDELRSEEDPTILKPRSWLDTEWNSFRNESSDLDFTVTNNGDVTTGTLSDSLGGTDAADWTVVTSTCTGVTLTGGATCSRRAAVNSACSLR